MKVLTLSDNVLLGFARDKQLIETSAEIRRLHSALSRSSGGCRCRKRRGNMTGALASLKHAIAHNANLASKLKARTQAQKLVVLYRQGNKLVKREV